MRPWLRRSLYALAAALLIVFAGGVWLVRSFDGPRVQRIAADWMLAQHGRTLAFDGPLTLQLWPQPALTVAGARLSEPGQPDQPFAGIAQASLTLRLAPLLQRREIEVDHVSARGVQLHFRRDAEGRRNIDDLMARAATGERTPGGAPVVIESIELADVDLHVADAQAGLTGRFAIREFKLGAFGPGLRSPLHLQAQAALTQPALNAALVLDTELQLLAPAQASSPPVLHLAKTALHLQGQGFAFEGLDARLQAEDARFRYGAGSGLGDGEVDVSGLQVQFSGARAGWKVDAGQLGLARLHLGLAERRLDLEKLALHVQGRNDQTTLDARLDWPMLQVAGESLQGGPVEGKLALGGDQRLLLKLSSQAPAGSFERITLPALMVEADGQIGPSAVQGRAESTLVLTLQPLAAALEPLALNLTLRDPTLPPLQLALQGVAQLSARAGSGRLAGTINDQRVEARVDATLDRARPFFDIDASFGTLDLNRFIAPANRNAAPAPSAAATPINLQALQSADARLVLRATRLVRPPYRVDSFDAQASVTNGVLDLRRLAGRAWGGRFEANGSADAASSRLALRLRADDVDLRALLTDTVGHDGLRGRGRVEADLRTRGATVGAARAALNGRVVLALRPAAVRGLDLAQTLRGWRTAPQGSTTTVAGDATRQTEFSQLDASFDVRDGVGHSTDLDGRSEFLRVTGEGTLDLARGRVDYAARVRVVNTASGRAGPEMVLLNGVTVPVGLDGPFGAVQWQVNWPAVTAGVAVRSVPNVARGAVGAAGGVVRGTGNLLRGAAGAVTGGAASPPAPPPPRR